MIQQILSCDWGTSSFRLRLIKVTDGSVLAETVDGKGIANVHYEWQQSGMAENERVGFYKNILLSAIEKLTKYTLNDVPVIISGMASSSIGIIEVPYAGIPFSFTDHKFNIQRIPSDHQCQHEIVIVSGLKTNDDAMRGEETMLFGCDIDDHEQLVIFPGTHSKHVTVKNTILTEVKTFMTGEIFDLLANKSILSKSVTKNENLQQYASIFEKGVKEGAAGNLLNTVFHVRIHQLFESLTAEENYHYLSGLLIGCELKQVAGTQLKILLVCSQSLYERYWQALQIVSINGNLEYRDADRALIDGHCRLAKLFL
ncbi:MAG: 2-dehydro-3-deoxygalactonokinase [Ginsengibacter sp.]